MKCPICPLCNNPYYGLHCNHRPSHLLEEIERLKEALADNDPNFYIEYYGVDKNELIDELKEDVSRLKSIIGRSSHQINLIKKNIYVTWFEEERLDSIGVILKEGKQ